MKEQAERDERKESRRDLLLILLIIPVGICCMFVAGQAAIGLAPTWDVAADMGSNLDPDIDFAADIDPGIIGPINSNILTQPVWRDIFLTPNAVIPTRIIPTKIPTLPPRPTTQPTVSVPTDIPTLVPPPTPTTVILPPPTKPPPPPTPPPPPPSANLDISKVASPPGSGNFYTIVVTNSGPDNASGFNITDNVPAAVTGVTINCTVTGTADCGTDASSGNSVSFTGASLDAGATNQITITITGTIGAGTVGRVVNTASVVIPGGAGFSDPDATNNNSTEAEPDAGSPDGGILPLPANSVLIIDLGTPIVVSGVPDPPPPPDTWDLVYYEYDAGGFILLDWIILEIGETQTGPIWYQVFNWGGGGPDTNSNVGGFIEDDNASIPLASLYGSPLQTGIAIDVDALGIPAGNYQFVRITSPDDSGAGNDGAQVDSLEVLP
jgi:uncharacterized repeat protein (TIGR01451 family)